jgi:hypothetical protein
MTHRRWITAAMATLLALAVASGAWAQAVLQSVTVRVNPGQMSTYLEKVAALQGVMDRVGGGGQVQVWNATAAGTNTGNSLVSVAYPSLTAYAETTTKTQADPEWQKVFASLPDIRTLVSSGLIVSRDGGGMPPKAESGAVLQGVLVDVKPGQLDAYVQRIGALKGVLKRVGSSATIRVWQATLAGPNTGTVAVGLVHPSLAAYAENSGKLQGDAEGQKLLEGLDAIRTVVSSSLFVAP